MMMSNIVGEKRGWVPFPLPRRVAKLNKPPPLRKATVKGDDNIATVPSNEVDTIKLKKDSSKNKSLSSVTEISSVQDVEAKGNAVSQETITRDIETPVRKHCLSKGLKLEKPPPLKTVTVSNDVPVPSAEVVNVLEQLCRPDVQEFLKKLTEHFSVGACSHQANECFENIQPTYTQLDTVLERHICTTPLPSSSHFGGINQVKATFKATPERSPRKEVSSGQEDVQSNMQVKLLEAYDLTVHKDGLRKAISAAKKSQKPGYTLCYKLLPEAFSLEMLANSRGQGMTSVKEGDLRPCLDKTKVCAIKDYVLVWCKKNGHPTPLESSLNDAITERISYARKQIKMALKKLKN